jgi:hypothetical protein
LHFSLVSASNRTRQNCKMQMNFSSAVVWFLIIKSDICLSWASLVKYIHTYNRAMATQWKCDFSELWQDSQNEFFSKLCIQLDFSFKQERTKIMKKLK